MVLNNNNKIIPLQLPSEFFDQFLPSLQFEPNYVKMISEKYPANVAA